MLACVVRVFRSLWATVAIFVESSNDARLKISQAEKGGRTQIIQGLLQALSRARRSY